MIRDEMTDTHALIAALAWQIECGADEALSDTPCNRYELAQKASGPAPRAPRFTASPAPAPVSPPATPAEPDPVAEAERAAAQAQDLGALHQALAGFAHCALRQGARNTVFADGVAQARVMIVGEAPGRDEDLEGRPFVGRAGQLLDRMFAAIGLSRSAQEPSDALYIANVLPWRPPGNRDPEPAEIAMMRPFLARHIALARPQVLVAMGNTPLSALTGQRGIMRVRGQWMQAFERPVLPMTHPAYLLRNPAAKREAWADLLALRAWLERMPPPSEEGAA